MRNAALTNFIFYAFFFCSSLDADTIDGCGNRAFQLSLFGRKRGDDQWNTTYRLERFSCNTTENWNLIIRQNITESGSMQKIYLHGYFAENGKDTFENGSHPVALTSVGQVLPYVPSLGEGSFGKPECPKYSEGSMLKVVTRYQWNARRPTAEAKAMTKPFQRVYLIYSSEINCTSSNTCILEIQKLQDANIKTYHHIYGNFHAAGDGLIYEGLGWNFSHDGDLNLVYFNGSPSPQNMASFALLIRGGVRTGKIWNNYTLHGSRSEITKKWINWTHDAYGD